MRGLGSNPSVSTPDFLYIIESQRRGTWYYLCLPTPTSGRHMIYWRLPFVTYLCSSNGGEGDDVYREQSRLICRHLKDR